MTRSVQITGTGQLIELQRRLRSVGQENVRASMQRRLRRAAEPLRDDLQTTIRTLVITGKGRTTRGGPSPTTRPLRATIARAIRISVRTTPGGAGARVWIDRGALPPDMRNLPELIDRGRIRHPTFNNRSSRGWVNQNARPGWWSSTTRQHQPRMRAEVARVLDDIRNRLG